MQLVDVDAIQAQPLQAAIDGLAQVFRAGVVSPLPGSWTIPSTLGRNHKIPRVRRQCFSDQFFANERTVGIGRVYEIDAQLNGTAKYRERRSRILGWSPNSIAGDAHGSEAE